MWIRMASFESASCSRAIAADVVAFWRSWRLVATGSVSYGPQSTKIAGRTLAHLSAYEIECATRVAVLLRENCPYWYAD